MEASPLTGLSHLVFRISDLDTSAEWYTKALGLQPFQSEPGRFVGLRSPSGHFLVTLVPGGQPESNGALDHIAFSVADFEALTAWSAHLVAIGVDHEGVKVNPAGGHSIDLFDPDGNNIEFTSRT